MIKLTQNAITTIKYLLDLDEDAKITNVKTLAAAMATFEPQLNTLNYATEAAVVAANGLQTLAVENADLQQDADIYMHAALELELNANSDKSEQIVLESATMLLQQIKSIAASHEDENTTDYANDTLAVLNFMKLIDNSQVLKSQRQFLVVVDSIFDVVA